LEEKNSQLEHQVFRTESKLKKVSNSFSLINFSVQTKSEKSRAANFYKTSRFAARKYLHQIFDQRTKPKQRHRETGDDGAPNHF
jgi:hypothetical protein